MDSPLLAAMMNADLLAGEALIRAALDAGTPGADILDDTLAPAMRAIGELWESGEASVAKEHLATGIALKLLLAIYPSLVTAPPCSRERVLLACAEGERHALGLRVAADVLEGAGFDVRSAGPDLPAADLARAIARHRPRIVGISNTVALDASALARLIGEIRGSGREIGVMVGGAGTRGLVSGPGLAVAVDAKGIVPAAERLLSG